MKKLFILAIAVISFNLNAQTKAGVSYKNYFTEASSSFSVNNFPKALEKFKAAYQVDSGNSNINYLLGVCYLHTPMQKAEAETYLERAVKSISPAYKNNDPNEKSAPPIAHFYYGQALHINYSFNGATQQYNYFSKYIPVQDIKLTKMLEKERAITAYAKEMVTAPLTIQILNLGDSINSKFPEYNPVLSADEKMLIYTTKRPNTTGGLKDAAGFYNDDIVVSYKNDNGTWSSPRSISPDINTNGQEACVNLTPDGQTLLIYKNGTGGTNGNIYYSTFDGKGWSVLKDFGPEVNTQYKESHACLSADGNLLFVVSNRPGGFGGKDIYRFVKLPNGKWSKAVNLGPTINTEYDEDGAFLHPDGRTFYFTSKGNITMGGLDIKFTTLNDEYKPGDVSNIGYPINTTDDDAVFFVTSPDSKRSYISSAKPEGLGEKDIYMITMPEAKERPLALFKGRIIAAAGERLPEHILIVVTDKETGEIIGNYRPKSANGSFSTILPPGREYNFSYVSDGNEFYNEDVFVTKDLTYQEIKREVSLEPVAIVGKIKARQNGIILNVIVFDNSKNKKTIPGAKITINENGGGSENFNCNDKGRYDGIILLPEKKYTLIAEADGKKSILNHINITGIKEGKVINHLLYMSVEKN
jgi:tetratricopeptide (TPR) repeat protein